MGTDALSEDEKKTCEANLEKVDWTLPGMDQFDEAQKDALKRSILRGTIVNSIHCLGWALWPIKNEGYYNESWLRTIADFLEIQNKPFWDEYDAYCEANDPDPGEGGEDVRDDLYQWPSCTDEVPVQTGSG